MEKDIGEIPKNEETKIIIRIDDFGGQPGLTIREFVTSQNYTGFTKAGVRIKADKFEDFKAMINSIDSSDLTEHKTPTQQEPATVDNDEAGIDEQGLM
ncbi:hypothetical protein HN903_00825 [archaeon]|jgi:hypothetical protein|nr:hypothetical protein [archaeon]MBT7128275.1 hypothetical protein [archaeon]